MLTIPVVKLSKQEEEFCLEKLRTANVLLAAWSEKIYGGRKNREFRRNLFNGIKTPAIMNEMESKLPASLVSKFREERATIIEVHETPVPCLDNRTVEWAMFCSYHLLCRKRAKRWCGGEGSGMSLDDYLAESHICLIDTIYGYIRNDIKFSTFLWKCLENRMSYVHNRNNMLCPLTNEDLTLWTQYEEAKLQFNDHVTFDQVVEAMGLDEEQCRALGVIMTKVVSESQIVSGDGPSASTNINHGNDYTSLRLGKEGNDNIVKLTVSDAIKRANLTPFERIVLDASMVLDPETGEPYYGWQTEVAKNNINPGTGEPYSRMWVGMALTAAYKKLKRVLKVA